MKLRISFPNFPIDLIICMIWSIVLLPIVLLNIEGIIRIIIGLPFILFIPGYILVFCLFPEKKMDQGIDIIERIALSLGLSLAVVPLIGLVLNYSIYGIRLQPILFSILFFNFAFGMIGFYRWYNTRDENRFKIDFSISLPKKENKIDKVLTIILVSSIIIAFALLIYVVITPKTGERFTEFYILGEKGIADDYPSDLFLGENANVTIGIINHEYKKINYTIEIWLINQTLTVDPITNETNVIYHHMWFIDKITTSLDHVPINIESNWTSQWEYFYPFTATRLGNYKLLFLLFDEQQSIIYTPDVDYLEIAEEKINNAYRSLHLWLDIS